MKNKVWLSIMALSLSCLLQSCSKDHTRPETTGPDPLLPEVTMLWPGEDSIITIKEIGKVIKVTSSDDKIVKAIINNNGIKLSAEVPGIVTINVTDEINRTAIREVRAITLDYAWRNVIMDEDYKTSIIVEANNAAFANELKSQLLLKTDEPYRIEFRTDLPENGTNTFRVRTYANPSVTTLGTFTFHSLILELASDADKKIYRVIPLKNRQILGLEEDLTQRYKQLHPDKGIQRVIITHYIKQYIQPG